MGFRITKKKLIEQYNRQGKQQPETAYRPDIETFSKYVPKGSSVLDQGCNGGIGSHLLAEAGYKVTGLDINPAAIDQARKRYGKEGIRFRLEKLKEQDEQQYDAVFSRNVLADVVRVGGLKRLDRELKRLYESIKPSGTLYATTYLYINADFTMKSRSLTEGKVKREFEKYFEIVDSRIVEEKSGKGEKKRLILIGRKK